MRTVIIYLMLTTAAAAQSLEKPHQLPPTGNFVYIDQIGTNNITAVTQDGGDGKQVQILMKGDDNNITVLQENEGAHQAVIGPDNYSRNAQNDYNTLSILQQGAGNHTASITLSDTTSNSNNTATIIQSGGVGADKQFQLTLSGSHIGATVIQDNQTTPDSGSMSIACYTGPCTGYSYVRH